MLSNISAKFFQFFLSRFKSRYVLAMMLISRIISVIAGLCGYYYAEINIDIPGTGAFRWIMIISLIIFLSIETYIVIRYSLRITRHLSAYLDENSPPDSDQTNFYENIWQELLDFPEKQVIYETKLLILLIALPLSVVGSIYLIFSYGILSKFSFYVLSQLMIGIIIGIAFAMINLWFFYERFVIPVLQNVAVAEPNLFYVPIESAQIKIHKRLTFIFISIVIIPLVMIWAFFYQAIQKISLNEQTAIDNIIMKDFNVRVIIVTLLTLVLALVFSRLLANSISRPIDTMLPQIGRIARGDLRGFISVISRNEVGELAVACNQLIQSIRFLVKEIKNADAMIISSSFHVLNVSKHQKSDAANQVTSIVQIQATAEELARSFSQIVDRANTGQNLAGNTLTQARKGQKLIDKNAEALQKIREQSQNSIEKTQNFVSQSQQINQIFETIQTIVAQTKMIALNASIEAAGSGAGGRRFSVIASEIRKLADQSTKLLTEISRTVHVLQASTIEMIDSLETEIQTIEGGVTHAKRIQQVFKNILDMTEENAESVKQISGVASQQTIAHEQIVESIAQMSETANKIAESSNNLSDLTVQFDELARKLSTSVQDFKTT